MTKRPNPRSVKTARTYTIDEAADALGVSIGTIRSWVKSGLPLMKSRKPFLILGDNLRGFLQARAANSKVSLLAGQLYCLTCKAGREPLGMMVDCIPQTAKTARLTGLCDVCSGTCNQIVSLSKLDQLRGIFDVAMKGVKTA
jgi:excisionase family DNA binding protein